MSEPSKQRKIVGQISTDKARTVASVSMQEGDCADPSTARIASTAAFNAAMAHSHTLAALRDRQLRRVSVSSVVLQSTVY